MKAVSFFLSNISFLYFVLSSNLAITLSQLVAVSPIRIEININRFLSLQSETKPQSLIHQLTLFIFKTSSTVAGEESVEDLVNFFRFVIKHSETSLIVHASDHG